MVRSNPLLLLRACTLRAVTAMAVAIAAAGAARAQTASPVWTVPEVGALPDDDRGRLVRRGRDLITATYAHIGPEVPETAKRFAGNNLACSNCHLDAGTKKAILSTRAPQGCRNDSFAYDSGVGRCDLRTQ